MQYSLYYVSIFLVWQSKDSSWVFYEGFSSQLYNILLVPISRYVLISNFEMLFHHIPTRGVATWENDLGVLQHIPLISASEAQQFIPRSSASAIASEPLSDLSLSTLPQGTSHPLCYTPCRS